VLAAFARAARDLVVQDVSMPEPRPGEALVRLEAAGICGSDLHFHRSGRHNDPPRFAGGHEIAGTVVSIDAAEAELAPGVRVAVEPIVACLACRYCAAGNRQLCVHLAHVAVGFAEFAAVPRDSLHVLPTGLSSEEAALADVVAVALHAVRRVPLRQEDSAVIVGDGPLGLVVAALLARSERRWLAVVGSHEHSLAVARRLGVDHVATHRETGLPGAVLEATNGVGADVVYECVGGDGRSLALAMELARPGGTVAVLGACPPPSTVDLKRPLLKEANLRFCFSYGTWNGRSEFADAIDLLDGGVIPTAALVTHRFPLRQIQAAFEAALDRTASRAIKVVVAECGR
jgi:threonine dehydrogenase-like Zn-dependent dehydrogenase